jgi:hypothetical protein
LAPVSRAITVLLTKRRFGELAKAIFQRGEGRVSSSLSRNEMTALQFTR